MSADSPEVRPAPALSVGEWEAFTHGNHLPVRVMTVAVTTASERHVLLEKPHVIAAMALYGQAWGFTHADVSFIRFLADAHEAAGPFLGNSPRVPSWWPKGVAGTEAGRVEQLRSIASRIASLLPPEP